MCAMHFITRSTQESLHDYLALLYKLENLNYPSKTIPLPA
jgi:hypothetical protein